MVCEMFRMLDLIQEASNSNPNSGLGITQCVQLSFKLTSPFDQVFFETDNRSLFVPQFFTILFINILLFQGLTFYPVNDSNENKTMVQ